MKSNKIQVFNLPLIFLCLLIGVARCKKSQNPILGYLENAEIQCEGREQEENIIAALKDILNLSEEELMTKRYKDYTGKEDQWDLPTLIYRHFVPGGKVRTLGDNFYHDIKSKEVQKIIKQILEKIEQFPE